MMKKNAFIKIKKIIELLKKRFGKKLVSVILFGSYTKNKKVPNDLDLIIIARNIPYDNIREKILTTIERETSFPLDMILLTPEEFKTAVSNLSPLILSIFENKYKVLYGEDIIKKEKIMLMKQYIIKKLSNLAWKIEPIKNV